MKKALFSFLAVTVLSACTENWQLVTLKSDLMPNANDTMEYADSLVRISYDFYSEEGKLKFRIYNLSEKPIYIDWKNSVYIEKSGTIHSYWDDRAVVNGSAISYENPFLNYSFFTLSSSFSGEIKKAERITFLPPQTGIEVAKFKLYENQHMYLFPKDTTEVQRNWDNRKKPVQIIQEKFETENSPLSFRNYLTISTSEDFKIPIHYDFKFWVSQVEEMDARQLTGTFDYKFYRDVDGNTYPYHPFRAPNRFFISTQNAVWE